MQRRLESEQENHEDESAESDYDDTDCSPEKAARPEEDADCGSSSGVSSGQDEEEEEEEEEDDEAEQGGRAEEAHAGEAGAVALPGPLHCEGPYEEDTHWKRGSILGRGACGTVFKVADIRTGLEMAMKEV